MNSTQRKQLQLCICTILQLNLQQPPSFSAQSGRSLQFLLPKFPIGWADSQYATRATVSSCCSTVILVDRSWEEAPTALWTFIATSFGLTIAAIIQFKKNQLSLLEALQISNLVWLANFGIFVALASYSRHKKDSRRRSGKDRDKHEKRLKRKPNGASDYWVKTAAMVQTLLSMALTLYMWATIETFGPFGPSGTSGTLECASALHYVLFIWPISVRGVGRPVGLTFASILTCAYIATTIHEHYISYKKRRYKSQSSKKGDDSPILPVFLEAPPLSSPLPSASPSRETYTLHALIQTAYPRNRNLRPNRPDRRRWSDIDPMFIGILIFETVVFLYLIVSNEILLRDNHLQSNSFGFGQILALVVALPVLLSVIGAFRDFGLRPRHRELGSKKSGRRHRGTRNTHPA
ncbi:hypothetical protein D9757_004677 [Collybiopsis confluens]|uniref:Uncharacterized protein n=1 Tax=Collybiopsis confluens TaxID=2823264 RepID=A0A8H5MC76_9AGAR|nr:hypothetical protein D9757_004677 [Collybiopsis confluens]